MPHASLPFLYRDLRTRSLTLLSLPAALATVQAAMAALSLTHTVLWQQLLRPRTAGGLPHRLPHSRAFQHASLASLVGGWLTVCRPLRLVIQIGDVILVENERALERNNSVYGLYPLVGSEVLTESGEFLGRVREFTFDPDDGAVLRLVFDAFGVPLIPETVVSCYAVNIDEVRLELPSPTVATYTATHVMDVASTCAQSISAARTRRGWRPNASCRRRHSLHLQSQIT
jgi:sporulation protein YlmC with PRC-barrel domain